MEGTDAPPLSAEEKIKARKEAQQAKREKKKEKKELKSLAAKSLDVANWTNAVQLAPRRSLAPRDARPRRAEQRAVHVPRGSAARRGVRCWGGRTRASRGGWRRAWTTSWPRPRWVL